MSPATTLVSQVYTYDDDPIACGCGGLAQILYLCTCVPILCVCASLRICTRMRVIDGEGQPPIDISVVFAMILMSCCSQGIVVGTQLPQER